MAERTRSRASSGFSSAARFPPHLAHHERLSRVTGLAVLSSDALSSVAYATEEILRVLVRRRRGGAEPRRRPIGVVIATLLAIVVFSYRQTIHAYPTGGGAYIVAKDNLGDTPALVAAAALLIDYVLTVAVSIAAGVAAITSAFPALHVNRVELSLAFVVVLMLGNLRGIRESGRIFAVPTYFFIVQHPDAARRRRWRCATGTIVPRRPGRSRPRRRARAADDVPAADRVLERLHGDDRRRGGVERRAGVPAAGERRTRPRRWSTMAVLSITMFVGITLLAHAYGIVPSDTETVVSQLARGVFGGRGVPVLRGAGRRRC